MHHGVLASFRCAAKLGLARRGLRLKHTSWRTARAMHARRHLAPTWEGRLLKRGHRLGNALARHVDVALLAVLRHLLVGACRHGGVLVCTMRASAGCARGSGGAAGGGGGAAWRVQ